MKYILTNKTTLTKSLFRGKFFVETNPQNSSVCHREVHPGCCPLAGWQSISPYSTWHVCVINKTAWPLKTMGPKRGHRQYWLINGANSQIVRLFSDYLLNIATAATAISPLKFTYRTPSMSGKSSNCHARRHDTRFWRFESRAIFPLICEENHFSTSLHFKFTF